MTTLTYTEIALAPVALVAGAVAARRLLTARRRAARRAWLHEKQHATREMLEALRRSGGRAKLPPGA